MFWTRPLRKHSCFRFNLNLFLLLIIYCAFNYFILVTNLKHVILFFVLIVNLILIEGMDYFAKLLSLRLRLIPLINYFYKSYINIIPSK